MGKFGTKSIVAFAAFAAYFAHSVMITLPQGLSGGKFGTKSTFAIAAIAAIAAKFTTEGNAMGHTPSTLTTFMKIGLILNCHNNTIGGNQNALW